MLPVTEALAKEYKGRADILYCDIYERRLAVMRWNIRSIPVIIMFDKKGNMVFRDETGVSIETHVRNALNKLGVKGSGESLFNRQPE